MRKDDSEQKENAEQVKLAIELAEADRREEESWGIKTDIAAHGRKRINIPDRPY